MFKFKNINFNIELSGISHKEIMFFTKHLAISLKSGLTLFDAIELLSDEAGGKMKQVVNEILEALKTGQNFYSVLEKYPKYFSSIYINLVKTGELAGTLEENLNRLALQLSKDHDTRQKIKSALMYPMLILIAIVGLGLSVAIFVLPKIIPLFKSLDTDLPTSTVVLIKIAELFQNHGKAILIGIIAFFTACFWLVKQNFAKPAVHSIILKIPIVKDMIKNIQLQRFNLTLGTLLSSAVTLDRSLLITGEATENRVYRAAIKSFINDIEQGKSLAEGLANYPKLFPRISSRLIAMGEHTGGLEQSLLYLAELYEDEVDNIMKNLTTILEPALLIFIGLTVGAVAISILGPIYKITGNLRT
jgi:type IV pilus assembly protein PilC